MRQKRRESGTVRLQEYTLNKQGKMVIGMMDALHPNYRPRTSCCCCVALVIHMDFALSTDVKIKKWQSQKSEKLEMRSFPSVFFGTSVADVGLFHTFVFFFSNLCLSTLFRIHTSAHKQPTTTSIH